MNSEKSTLEEFLIEYIEGFLKYQPALWMFCLMNFAMIGFLAISLFDMKGASISDVESLSRTFELGIWMILGILMGRPILHMVLTRLFDRWGVNQ